MRCEELSAELLAYHFGLVSPEEREAIEQHLLSCPACCRAFVLVKRSVEVAPSAPLPSASARQRLRGAVAEQIARKSARSSWWERSLSVGFAALAVVVAMLTTRAIATSEPHGPHGLAAMTPSR
jgi:anti-sigma factor RsiW